MAGSHLARLATRATVAALALTVAAIAGSADRLPALGADLTRTTVSGISSGGYMAVQFHVAHSDIVRGAGILAAGPYYCAQGSVWSAWYACMKPTAWTPVPETGGLAAVAERWAAQGRIAATGNLRTARVWAFAGSRDETVYPVVVEALAAFYSRWVAPEAMRLEKGVAAGHAMVTEQHGAACGATEPPFINDCDFDAAGKLLGHLLGPLQGPGPGRESGRLIRFDQREFSRPDPYLASLDDTGYAFVPDDCRASSCAVHVAYHGCRQGAQSIGERFATQAGYNRWAAVNRIIVLYPQAIARNGWGGWRAPWSYVFNPRGCWDWWGYTGPDYATRGAPQIESVAAMLRRLAEPRTR